MDSLTHQARALSLPRSGPYLVAIGLTAAALSVLLPLPFYVLYDDPHSGGWGYNAGAMALTYFETGFARRELAGTLARFFSRDPMIAAAVLYILTTFALAAALIVLVTRSRSTLTRRMVFAVAVLVILWRLMSFIGGIDALIMLLGLAAALAATRERWIAASIIVFIAMLVHETGVIVLMPLLTTICFERRSWRSLLSSTGAIAAAIFATALLVYFYSLVPIGHVGEIGRHVHAEIATRDGKNQAAIADVAVYYVLSGVRGLRTAQCVMWSDPGYSLQFASAVLVTILFGAGLRSWKRWPSLLLTLAWVIALSLIGTDMGRWTNFALFSVLTTALLDDSAESIGMEIPMIFSALVAFMLMSLGSSAHSNYSPIPLARLIERSPNFLGWHGGKTIDACDPTWLVSIGL